VSRAGGTPFKVAAIDLTQAPATFSMLCHGAPDVTFVNPCWVALSASNSDPSAPAGINCMLPGARGIGWSFPLMVPPPQNPEAALPLPPTDSNLASDAGNTVSKMDGSFTFDAVDPAQGAFIAHFGGTVTWTKGSGAMFECKIDTPIWGTPNGRP
jgi:hypothetical protein